LIAARPTLRRSFSLLGEGVHDTSCDLNWEMASNPTMLTSPYEDLATDYGKGYSLLFIFVVRRGRVRDFVCFQLLGWLAILAISVFRSRLLSCEATVDYS